MAMPNVFKFKFIAILIVEGNMLIEELQKATKMSKLLRRAR